jgi:hypothetical protein
MNKASRNLIILLLLIIYVLVISDKFENSTVTEYSIAIACSIIAPIIAFIFDSFLRNILNIKLWIRTSIFNRKKKVRMSMSYVYRIKVADKYLLVKNSKWDYFQPVGGVYKRLSNDLNILEDRFDWQEDDKMGASGVRKSDLRGHIPAPKVLNFLAWFKSGQNRETSHWREFFEELISSKILSSNDFPYIEYSYAGTVVTPLKHSTVFNCLEILSYDVFDVILNPVQVNSLLELQKKDSDLYAWVSPQLIKTIGYNELSKDQEVKVSEHAKWTLNMKYEL